ncbi:MAG TPA: ParB N-terminal domain-containing protein [Leadbetterella sp.]|nr:ParB N-terminal domain-containing protein [Leadbetterella sp.]
MNNQTLKQIETSKIKPNPHNPRLIFHEKELDDLKSSIEIAGVLVPITVYQEKEDEYIILDGERRWRACTSLGKETIPANIIDKPKDVTQNILHMFNIHYFREQWELFPTALKLEQIIKLLQTDKDSILSRYTGLNLTTVKRCKVLLWYPEKYRDLLLYKQGRISTDFFIELYPIIKKVNDQQEYNNELKISRVIDGLIDKFNENKSFSDVKEFREMRKAIKYYETKGEMFVFIKHLNEFIEKPEITMEHFTIDDLEVERTKNNVLKQLTFLSQALTDDNIELLSDYYVLEQLIQFQEKLNDVILKLR